MNDQVYNLNIIKMKLQEDLNFALRMGAGSELCQLLTNRLEALSKVIELLKNADH